MNDTNLLEDQPIAWTPTPEVIERAQLTRFMKQVGVSTWDELYQSSIRDVEKFTEEVLKFLDIRFDPPYGKLLDISGGVEFPKWFGGSGNTPVPIGGSSAERSSERRSDVRGDKSVRAPAGLNITTMCLDRWQTDEMKDQPAVIFESEIRPKGFKEILLKKFLGVGEYSRALTYGELFDEVYRYAVGLRHYGFGKGDAIGIHMPMTPSTVVILLAIARIGAVAVPVFSGYGVEAIATRLNAVKAKGLCTILKFPRRGKWVNALDVAIEATSRVPSIQRVFWEGYAGDFDSYEKYSDLDERRFILHLEAACEDEGLYANDLEELEPTSAEDPLIILYTSGTTGKPKGIAHTHASFPIKAAQDMAFGTDVGKGTRISWYTDIGWMMGPWLIYGALINGATICIYDGAPDYPTPDRMWEFCAKHKVEVLGISPTLVRSLARSGDTLVPTDVASTSGQPLDHAADQAAEKRSLADKSVRAPIDRKGWSRKGRLPHYDGNVTQFVTFRLADSLPQSVLEALKLQLKNEKLDNDSEEYRQKVEEYLDQGIGECILQDPVIAEIVRSTILYENGKSCYLKAWIIMPNHVHLLLRMCDGCDLAGLMKRIKGVSARKINQLTGRSGPVWQADYFDRYIRDAEHFDKVFRYIENNPVAAGLTSTPEDWEFGSATPERSADTLVRIGGSSAETSSERRSDVRGDKSVPAPFVPAPFERHDLSSLRIFASTGEPWNPAPWWWLFEKVGNSKLPIINYSGGTEISGGILMGNPLLPEKPCSFPATCPGMDVDIVDDEGRSVEPGKVGELVIKQPWIGMARGFWQEKERYLETYWSRFKNIWVHGDFAMRDKDGHWFILGRSDDTLKVAGKRVGPAEVESLLVAHPLVTEAAVIGVPDEVKGTAMVAFVVRSGDAPAPLGGSSAELDSERSGDVREDKSVLASLEAELKSLVARDMGKPLSPSRIHFVSALPKTRNAKVMRRVIRSAYLGEDPGDLSALENPGAVDEIKCINHD